MSEQPDKAELGTAKDELSHVETKSGGDTTKLVFKCEDCDHTEDISPEIQDLMEADKSYDAPQHHDKAMKPFVAG